MSEDYEQTARWLEANWEPLHVHEKMRALIRERDEARAAYNDLVSMEKRAGTQLADMAMFEIAEAEQRGYQRGVRDAAEIAGRDVDWTKFGTKDLQPWETGPDSLRDYRLGIAVGRSISAAILALLEKPKDKTDE